MGKGALFRPHPQPLSHSVGEGCKAHGGAPCSAFPLSRRRERGTKRVRAKRRTCPFTPARGKSPPPHPQPLSHSVGEGCRGARRCALQRVPPLPQAGEGDKGGEGKKAHLPIHARAGKIAPAAAILHPTDVPLPARAHLTATKARAQSPETAQSPSARGQSRIGRDGRRRF